MNTLVVNGKKVVEERPVPSPLPPKNGKQVFFTRIKELILDDGTSVYSDSGYKFFADTPGKVRGYLGAETRKAKPKVKNTSSVNAELETTIAKRVFAIASENKKLRQKVKSLEATGKKNLERAKAAEKELRDIKKILGI